MITLLIVLASLAGVTIAALVVFSLAGRAHRTPPPPSRHRKPSGPYRPRRLYPYDQQEPQRLEDRWLYGNDKGGDE